MPISTMCHNVQNFETRLEKIYVMKWLLDLEDKDIEITEPDLHKMLDLKLDRNFAGLIPLISYLQKIPQFILKDFFDIISQKDNYNSYNELYNNFKYKLINKTNYKNFNYFIEKQICRGVIFDNKYTSIENLEAANTAIFEQERLLNILIFNIVSELCNDIIKFECERNIVIKFHLLDYWSKINKFKPIEKLNDDECKVISSLFAGFDNESILEFLNLPPNDVNYNYLDKILISLPGKFHVNNLTQVIFRILLLKPKVWQKSTVENMLYEIKNLHQIICD